MKILFAHAAALCFAASCLNAQTVDETLVTLKEAFDWQGESSSNSDGLTSMTLVPDGCTFTFDVTGEVEGALLAGRLTVPFQDIDTSTVAYSERSLGMIFRFDTKGDLKTVRTAISATGAGPFMEELREDAKDATENIKCDAQKCEMTKLNRYAPSTSLAEISKDRQLVVVESVKTLEALCKEQGS